MSLGGFRAIAVLAAVCSASIACAQTPTPATNPLSAGAPTTVNVADSAFEARVKSLSAELRCLVCQNQSVADSDAPVARDMREQVRAQLAAGKSDAEVKRYMTERFGDFVLYRPPLKATTLALWIGPFVVLLFAMWYALRRVRTRQRATASAPTLTADERARARALLDQT